jgi:hypothetical protein
MSEFITTVMAVVVGSLCYDLIWAFIEAKRGE